MCGFSGFYFPMTSVAEPRKICLNMINQIVHRGPDDSGVWLDEESGIALGHRRLSILDLTLEGHQPMASSSHRYVVAYNGELYNFQGLRAELEKLGCRFRGHSDTEVLLASIEAWGLDEALKQFVGMFAFALWDKRERCLSLVRDRLGEKPLYYGWQNGVFLFGSELKALKAYPEWQGEINRDSLTLYLRHNYIPAPYSIYKDIYKLTPGTILHISSGLQPGELPEPRPYWRMKGVVEEGLRNPINSSDEDAIASLDGILRTSIREKMVSDVPLGAFLSGGIDSSVVVALMQSESERPVKTFSIGFNVEGYNEAVHAKAVAKHLGTEHTELYVTAEQAMDVIPKLPYLYDEPFSDSSQIPTFLVSEMTRKYVTVALSGDGGDELFCGYSRYFMAQSIWNKIGKVPFSLRSMTASLIEAVPPDILNSLLSCLNPIVAKYVRKGPVGDKLHKLAEMLRVENDNEFYRSSMSHWQIPEQIVIGATEPATVLTDPEHLTASQNYMQRMMYLDTVSYLPDDILVKVDRATMGVSLEARVPFLDHRVVEFAWQIPMNMKVRDGQGKWLLKQLLYKYVPKELIDRPKMGFGVPIDSWLRGPLREWAEELLDERRLRDEGFFYPLPIRQKWEEHLSGKRNWAYYIWDVLMFQAWLDNERSR